LERDPDGKLIPGLVESWQWLDKTTWQFKLRKGIKFQNGDECVAKDVKFSIERIINPETKSPQMRDLGSIDRIETIDQYIINFITKGPDPLLPSKFVALGNILPEEVFKRRGETEFFKNPIGTGPFKFVKWEKGKEIILEANEGYFRGSPKVKEVVFKFIYGEENRIKMLLNGNLDIVTNVMPQYTLDLKKDPRTKLVKKSSLQFADAVFNTVDNTPFINKKVRQAFNYATDVDKLIKYVQKGNGRRLATFTMPEEFGYNPTLKPYSFDLEKAKSLLSEAGYSNGFEIKILALEHLRILALSLVKQWEKIGVKSEIDFRSRDEGIKLGLIEKKISWDIFIGDPTDPLFDASHQMTIHLDPKHPVCRFHNDQIVKLLYESNITMDGKKRLNLLIKIQEIVYEEAPIVFLYQNINLYGVSAKVLGFAPYVDTMLRLYDVSKK